MAPGGGRPAGRLYTCVIWLPPPMVINAPKGSFAPGDVVRVENMKNAEVARGLTRYASEEIGKIRGKSSPDIERLLGRPALEVIHRDDMVLI